MARHLEDSLQIACVRWFDLQYPKLSPLLIHVPNGGKRNALEAARFKKMGVRAGVADLVLFYPNDTSGALFIELKAGRGKQSKYQEEFQHRVEANGYTYKVCRSLEEFISALGNYLGA